jgi:hypothetical protein
MLLSVIFSPNKFEGNHFIHVNVAIGHLVHNVAGGYLVHVHAAGGHLTTTSRFGRLLLSALNFLGQIFYEMYVFLLSCIASIDFFT